MADSIDEELEYIKLAAEQILEFVGEATDKERARFCKIRWNADIIHCRADAVLNKMPKLPLGSPWRAVRRQACHAAH